jgi:nucleotide-binding universal stress UspA family protein
MPEIRNILYTTDFSDSAEAAFPYAVALAELTGARLHLLHAVTPHDYDPQSDTAAMDSIARVFESLEKRAEEEFGARQGVCRHRRVDHVSVIRRGFNVAGIIQDYIAENAVDLLVMSTHGRGGLGHVLFGSVAEAVLRRCLCPAWLAKRDARQCVDPAESCLQPRRILIPTDLSANSARALPWARWLQAECGAEIHLLHVVEARFHPAYYAGGTESLFEIDPEARGRIQERVWEAFGLTPQERASIPVHLVEGNPPRAIVEHAEAHGVDLVIMSNNGYDEIEDYFVGSTTERVIRRGQWPVLVV